MYQGNAAQTGQPLPYAQPRPRRRLGVIVAIVVVILLVVIAVMSFAFLRSGAELRVYVYSTHLLTSVSYTLSIAHSSDENVVKSGTLDPLESLNFTTTFNWWFSDNATIVITAVSTGGLLGPISDGETLEVVDGGSYTVTLVI